MKAFFLGGPLDRMTREIGDIIKCRYWLPDERKWSTVVHEYEHLTGVFMRCPDEAYPVYQFKGTAHLWEGMAEITVENAPLPEEKGHRSRDAFACDLPYWLRSGRHG